MGRRNGRNSSGNKRWGVRGNDRGSRAVLKCVNRCKYSPGGGECYLRRKDNIAFPPFGRKPCRRMVALSSRVSKGCPPLFSNTSCLRLVPFRLSSSLKGTSFPLTPLSSSAFAPSSEPAFSCSVGTLFLPPPSFPPPSRATSRKGGDNREEYPLLPPS